MVSLWKEVLGPQLPTDTEHTAGQTELLGVLLHTFVGCSPSYCLTFAKLQIQNGLAGAQDCSWFSQVNTYCQKNFPWKQWSSPSLSHIYQGECLPGHRAGFQAEKVLGSELCDHQGKAGTEHHYSFVGLYNRIRPLRRQPPTYLFTVRGLMHN